MRNPWTGSLGRPAKHRQPNNFNLDNQNVGELINFWSKQKRKLLTTKIFGDNFSMTDLLTDVFVICQQHQVINIFETSLHP